MAAPVESCSESNASRVGASEGQVEKYARNRPFIFRAVTKSLGWIIQFLRTYELPSPRAVLVGMYCICAAPWRRVAALLCQGMIGDWLKSISLKYESQASQLKSIPRSRESLLTLLQSDPSSAIDSAELAHIDVPLDGWDSIRSRSSNAFNASFDESRTSAQIAWASCSASTISDR